MNKKDFTQKGLMGMKRLYFGLLTICFVMCSGLLFASHAQNIKLSLKLNNETMSVAIQKIAKESNVDFFYSQQQLNKVEKKVSVDYSDAALFDILTDVFKDTNFTFKFEENGVVVIPRPSTPVSAVQQPAKRELKGKVVEIGTKKPLAGATVIVSGTTTGAITDDNGDFVVSLTPANKEIEVSYTGYIETKVSVDKLTSIVVEMAIAAVVMEDVVVTGVFTRKSNTYSGATSTIKSEQLQRTGNLNIVQALGNIDPSFNVLVNNEMGSNPNALPDIQMRGAASFSDMKSNYSSSPNQPLFIVDGFEQSLQKVLDMDMNRVESVTLLKDATAKAIYGSKGANGVVVIETKAPLKGSLKVSYKGDLNIQTPVLRDYNLTSAAEKLEIERLAGVYDAKHPGSNFNKLQQYNEIYKEVLRGVDTDWLAQPTRIGVGQKHSLNIEGGDESIRYNVNVAYNNVAGVMKGSDRNTFEGGFNLQYRYKSLLFKEQFSLIQNKGVESPYGSFSDYAKMNPYWRAFDANGNVNSVLGQYDRVSTSDIDGDGVADSEYTIYNPMGNASTNYKNQTQYTDITNNFYIEWGITQDLKAIGRVGITKRSTNSDLFYPSNYSTLDPNSSYNFASVKPSASDDAYFKRGIYRKTNSDLFSLSSDVTLNYSKTIGRNLIFANAQYSVSQATDGSIYYEGQGFSDKATEIGQARQYKESAGPNGTDNKTNEIGAVASVNYSYDSRYLFDANYRANASSLFGANNRWGHFWSVGAGWNLHNEKFMSNVEWLDLAKIRASIGYTGSQNFAAYQALATYAFFTDEIYDNLVGGYLLGMSNPDLKWQQTQDQNIGIDLTILNKFDITFDYYVKNTSNLLTPITAAPSIGFDKFVDNLGKSQNKGIEAKVNYRVISNAAKDINLSVFANIAHNKNKLVEISDALSSINDAVDKDQITSTDPEVSSGVTKPRVEYAEGVSLSAIWGVRSLGIDPYNGKEMFLKRDGSPTYKWDAADKVVLGDELPKVQGSFGVNLDYKGFSVNAIFGYRIGGQFYNTTLVNNVENADLQYNVDKRVYTDRWNKDRKGVATKYKALEKNPSFTLPTSRFVQDYNEFRLSSLNIGYDFRNQNFMKTNKVVERLRLSFAMTDLLRLSTVKTERGTIYPYAQSFIFTVQATF